MVANGLLTTLIGLRLANSDISTFATGLVVSGFFVGTVLGCFAGHRIIASVGHIRAFAAFASIFSAASLAHAFLDDILIWWALRVVEGICAAGLFMCAESWLNERATDNTRGTILSLYTMTAGVSTGFGQFLLMAADIDGFALFALSSLLLSLALVPVALTRNPAPAVPSPMRFSILDLWKRSPLGLVACALAGLTLGAFYGMGPVFFRDLGLSSVEVAVFMGAAITGGMVLQWPIGHLSDRFDRRFFLLFIGAGIVIVGAAIAYLSFFLLQSRSISAAVGSFRFDGSEVLAREMWVSIPPMILFGALVFIVYPLAVAHSNDRFEAEEFVALSAGLLMAYSVGAIFGPIFAAIVMERIGAPGLFVFIAAMGLLLTVFVLWRIRTGHKLPLEEQAAYQAVPRTTPVAYELDPRFEDSQLTLDLEQPIGSFARGQHEK